MAERKRARVSLGRGLGIGLVLQSIMLAAGQIWANKTRSILTTLGIIIGVASVTSVIAALTGLKAVVLDEFEQFGTNKIFVWPDRPETGRFADASWRIIRFTPEQFAGLTEHCPSVEYVTLNATVTTNVVYAGETLQVRATGVQPDWHAIENRTVMQGRPITTADDEQLRQVCLITPTLRDKLKLDRDCVGESILVDNRRFLIVGLLPENPESSLGLSSDSSESGLFLPFQTVWRLHEPWAYAIATSRSPELSEDARAELRFYLRLSRKLLPDDPDTFGMEVMQQHLDRFQSLATGITMAASGIVIISLVVGGIGIMNIMLVSVSERTREIGLRKAVGARPSAILLQFLVEAIMLCFLGGAIGLGLGQGITMGLAGIDVAMLEKASIPPWAMLMSFGFAAAVGVIFGIFPALKASQLDPIVALRHE